MAHPPQASAFPRTPLQASSGVDPREGLLRHAREVRPARGHEMDGARMGGEDDAFERAAAMFRPEWEEEDAAQGSQVSAKQATLAADALMLGHAEPSVIVQQDVALAIEGPVGAPLHPPSAFTAPANTVIGTPSVHARHEATVVTKPLSMSALRALGFAGAASETAAEADELAMVGRTPANKKRWMIVGGAACVVVGIVIALATGGSSEPAPVVQPSLPAPSVQPLPAVAPATPAAPSTAAAASSAKSYAEPVAEPITKPVPVVSKKPIASTKPAARPVAARAPAKTAPVAKAAPAKVAAKPSAKPAPGKAKLVGKPAAKGKPVVEAKKARSPIDVLNPWGS